MSDTHADADATQLSSWVASTVSATVSTGLNKFANSEIELRRVGAVNAPLSLQFPVPLSC